MGRMRVDELESGKMRIRDLFRQPSTNRRHLDIAQKALREVIAAELTPRQRQVILMYYFEQKKACQIADELGVNPSTVNRTLHRAEAHIRRSMRFYFDYRSAVLEDDD